MPYSTLPSKGSFGMYWLWIFVNSWIQVLLVSPSDGQVAVGDDALGQLVAVDLLVALGRERLQQAGQRDRVRADVADHELRVEAELSA